MSCILRAADETFDVDGFLATSSLNPYKTWHVGERSSESLPPSTTAGFNVDVSDADMHDLPAQIEDAIEFLRENSDELRRLSTAIGTSRASLDFAVAHGPREIAVYCRLPPELTRLAGNLKWKLNCPSMLANDSIAVAERFSQMPSPFPGMNPYLEHEDAWHNFHEQFPNAVVSTLVPMVRPKYFVKVDQQVFINEPSADEWRCCSGDPMSESG